MIRFEDGAFATMVYSGYAHFDSDAWMGWVGEMGQRRGPDAYGVARARLATLADARRRGGAEGHAELRRREPVDRRLDAPPARTTTSAR